MAPSQATNGFSNCTAVSAGAAPSVTTSAFAASATPAVSGTTLTGPATLSYSGTADALTVAASGTGRGITSTVTNTGSGSSALFGSTVGTGAGLTGYNAGTGGPGGKFEVTNAKSTQAGAFVSTNGTGSALLATVTSSTGSLTPAILGQRTANTTYGDSVGIEGEGNSIGVYGHVPASSITVETVSAIIGLEGFSENTSATNNYGVYGSSSAGIGTGAVSESNYGLYAESSSNTALYALTFTGGSAIAAENNSMSIGAYGVYASIGAGNAIQGVATAPNGFGVAGQSTDGIGVYGYDAGNTLTGIGVFGASASGYAGKFIGNALVTGTLTVGNTMYSSDKNLKTNVLSIDGKDLLDRIGHLDISSWIYKVDPKKRHVGPMAQDFHAAFGLNGQDDTHISEVDIAGVSLAAIQELDKQMKLKDARINALEAQLATQSQAMPDMAESFSARMAMLEHQMKVSAQTAALGN